MNGIVELDDVYLDEIEVESQVLRSDERILAAEVASQRVDGLVQGPARAIVWLVRPEQRDDLLARNARSAGARQESEYRETSRLRRRTSNHVSIREYANAA